MPIAASYCRAVRSAVKTRHNWGPLRLSPSRGRAYRQSAIRKDGLTENAGRENDRPSKLQGMKLQDMKMQNMKMQNMKMTDQKRRQGVKWRDKKSTVSIEITLKWIVQMFNFI